MPKQKQKDPTKPYPAPKTKGKKPTFKTPNSIGSSGEMVGGPMKKGQGPSPTKGKKTALKIDIMLAKAMPGIGMPPKKVAKKASSFPKGTTKVLTAGTAYAVGKTGAKKVAKKKGGKK